jgi:hypothetical protein
VRARDIIDGRFAIEGIAASGGMGAADLRAGVPVALEVLLGPSQADAMRCGRKPPSACSLP